MQKKLSYFIDRAMWVGPNVLRAIRIPNIRHKWSWNQQEANFQTISMRSWTIVWSHFYDFAWTCESQSRFSISFYIRMNLIPSTPRTLTDTPFSSDSEPVDSESDFLFNHHQPSTLLLGIIIPHDDWRGLFIDEFKWSSKVQAPIPSGNLYVIEPWCGKRFRSRKWGN